jgi:hypothetical protein
VAQDESPEFKPWYCKTINKQVNGAKILNTHFPLRRLTNGEQAHETPLDISEMQIKITTKFYSSHTSMSIIKIWKAASVSVNGKQCFQKTLVLVFQGERMQAECMGVNGIH